MATATWRTREVPILEAIAQLTVEHHRVRHSSEIATATGLTDEEVALGIARLADAEYRPVAPGTGQGPGLRRQMGRRRSLAAETQPLVGARRRGKGESRPATRADVRPTARQRIP